MLSPSDASVPAKLCRCKLPKPVCCCFVIAYLKQGEDLVILLPGIEQRDDDTTLDYTLTTRVSSTMDLRD